MEFSFLLHVLSTYCHFCILITSLISNPIRRPSPMFGIVLSHRPPMTRCRQVFTKVWRFSITGMLTFHVLLLYGNLGAGVEIIKFPYFRQGIKRECRAVNALSDISVGLSTEVTLPKYRNWPMTSMLCPLMPIGELLFC